MFICDIFSSHSKSESCNKIGYADYRIYGDYYDTYEGKRIFNIDFIVYDTDDDDVS